jgi:hypothetical protein
MAAIPTPFDVLDTWHALLRDSMRTFSQPILPNWTFNIDSDNSSSPQTEADVVARYSYGRQLGRINDALAWIVEHHEDAAKADALREFVEMKQEIDRVKAGSAERRVEQLVADLASLRGSDRAAYDRLAAAVRRAVARGEVG